jgi:ribosome recycling factor
MTNEIIEKARHHMDRSIEAVKESFHTVRAGKASTSVLDSIRVDYYGTPTPLTQVATVSVPEARMIMVQPWEKKLLDVISKAIMTSDLGLNPSNDGNVIRVPLPELTEERRRDLVKQVHKLAEEGRVAVRNVRRDANDHLKKALKAGEITEDDERRGLKVVQDLTDEHIAKIDEQLKHKEHDILVI